MQKKIGNFKQQNSQQYLVIFVFLKEIVEASEMFTLIS